MYFHTVDNREYIHPKWYVHVGRLSTIKTLEVVQFKMIIDM